MRRLIQIARTRLRDARSDDGATVVFVAVALVGILALTAFAVDFGRMWEERRQLQNGADAAALAIAEDCVRGLCGGAYDEYTIAETYVDANARDGAAWAWNVELDMGAQTVTVHNATEDPGGDNKFDMLFAGIVGFDGFTVGAQATVAWGALGTPVSTIPIIISECEWQRPYWEGGAGGHEPPIEDPFAPVADHLFGDPETALPWLAPPDWWTAIPPTLDMDQDGTDDRTAGHASPFMNQSGPAPVPVVLAFHDGGSTDDCAAVAGQDVGDGVLDADGDGRLPGGFGWLDIDDDATLPCVAQVFGDWTGADPGSSPSTGCDNDDLADLLLGSDRNGTLNFIPFFDDVNDLHGQNGEYHVSGYGGFYIVGYNFGGTLLAHADPLTSNPCRPGGLRPLGWTSGNDDRCLVGYFVSAVYQGPGEIGPGGHGISTFQFTG